MPVGRTFSFESNDEGALHQNEQERLGFQPPYHDESPSRDIVSPPPNYSSPPPREPVSPASSALSAGRYQPSNQVENTTVSNSSITNYSRRRPVSQPQDDVPPPPPPHRIIPVEDRIYHQDFEQSRAYETPSAVTPGMDNFGDRIQGGGLDHLARGVADQHQRESGIEAQRALEAAAIRKSSRSPQRQQLPEHQLPARPNPSRMPERSSFSSNLPLAAGAATPGSITPVTSPHPRSSRYSGRSIQMEDYPIGGPQHGGYYGNYHDTPYLNTGRQYNATVSDASINPYDIADDGDDGFFPDPKRRSRLSSRNQSRERVPTHQSSSAGSVTVAGAGLGATAGALGGIFGRKQKNQVSSGSYDPVRQGNPNAGNHEKDDWQAREKAGNKRMGLTVGLVIGLIIVLAIIGGAVGGVLGNRSSNSGSSDNNAAGDTAANGDLDLNSPEIQALLNNPDLHKVFPGMDYTPWGTQYPLCLTYPPSQNNVTRDMAVLSQLTNAVRLYGTDCNQTEMVLHSIDRLQLTDMKVWLGVWIDTNQTTTNRQIAQMYKILAETNDRSIFKGAIIGNEALYRAGEDKAQSEAELIDILTSVKSKFTSLGYDIKVATSDLGDNWNGQLVEAVDMVMSNIHPFFAGVSAEEAAAWTINFWETHDLVLTGSGTGTDSGKEQIISETGWPSGGGTDCGGTTGACATGQSGSVAGVEGMNTFLDSWVCDALANGTEYFWFEAFDEPWKVIYNTATQQWEDKWGLMDPARNLKTGLKIPDCGGKTVS